MKIGISGLEEEVEKATGVARFEILKDGQLTVHFRSQSKLSQQELVDVLPPECLVILDLLAVSLPILAREDGGSDLIPHERESSRSWGI